MSSTVIDSFETRHAACESLSESLNAKWRHRHDFEETATAPYIKREMSDSMEVIQLPPGPQFTAEAFDIIPRRPTAPGATLQQSLSVPADSGPKYFLRRGPKPPDMKLISKLSRRGNKPTRNAWSPPKCKVYELQERGVSFLEAAGRRQTKGLRDPRPTHPALCSATHFK